MSSGEILEQVEELLHRLPWRAAREAEYADLAGEDGRREIANLQTRLGRAARAAQRDLTELRTHQHTWDYGDTESSPVRCTICGADGLA